ncbi:MAG TPA: hypothetical protein VFL13_06360 [Candidatus Baltobacteraceae bacterium]|nr:hypothetical protein [Candidatus Baltobacteraceae bacterium]
MAKLTTVLSAAMLAGLSLTAPAMADRGEGHHAARHVRVYTTPYGNYNYYYGGNYEAGYQHATIRGTILGVRSGYVADMRMDDGRVIPINERTLLRYGQPLYPGRHYTVYGYYGNGAFVADNLAGY